jgi:hypothetical protein
MPAPALRASCPVCDLVLAAPVLPPDVARAVLVCPKCNHRWPAPLAADLPPGPLRCSTHPEREATRVCDGCGEAWCDECDEDDRSQTVGSLRVSTCCLSKRLSVARVEIARPFWEDLPAVLTWSLRRAGLPVLLIFWIGSFVPFVSWLLLLVLAAYLQHVLRASARGASHLPPYPEFDEPVQDILYPLGRFLAVTAVLWFPWWFYRLFLGGHGWFLGALLALPAAALWPFAVTAASVGRSLRVLTDVRMLTSVLSRIRHDYWMTLALLAALAAPVAVIDGVSHATVAVLLASLLRYYGLFTGFHMLGCMVLQTRHAVDWEV